MITIIIIIIRALQWMTFSSIILYFCSNFILCVVKEM